MPFGHDPGPFVMPVKGSESLVVVTKTVMPDQVCANTHRKIAE